MCGGRLLCGNPGQYLADVMDVDTSNHSIVLYWMGSSLSSLQKGSSSIVVWRNDKFLFLQSNSAHRGLIFLELAAN